MYKWPLRWSSYTNLMSGESTRYHTKYFKLGEEPPYCTQIIKQLLFFHTLVEKMPRITLFGLLSFWDGKNNSSRQKGAQTPPLPKPVSSPSFLSFVQWTSIRKWDYLWDYHSEIINSVHRHINNSGNNSLTTYNGTRCLINILTQNLNR